MKRWFLGVLGLLLAFVAFQPDPVRAMGADTYDFTVVTLVSDLAASPTLGSVTLNIYTLPNSGTVALGGAIIAESSVVSTAVDDDYMKSPLFKSAITTLKTQKTTDLNTARRDLLR